MPMLPAAPGRFSTTTGVFRSLDSCVVTTRESTSGEPPAADGTTKVMGRSGQACATAVIPAASDRAARQRTNVRCMSFPLETVLAKPGQVITGPAACPHRKMSRPYNRPLSRGGRQMTDSEEFQGLSPEFCGHEARQGPPLSLRQIEVFRAIMMAGSISGAGRMLHVSQPAVSRVLALTETRLGYPLFE